MLTCSSRAAGQALSARASSTRPCRASRPARASAMSMSTRAPILIWRSISWKTQKRAARPSATRPRSCSSTAPSRRGFCPCCRSACAAPGPSTPSACAATKKPQPSWASRRTRSSTRNFWTMCWPSASWTTWRGPSAILRSIPRTTARPSSRKVRKAPPASRREWTARPSMSTPRRASRTAANSASAARWASRRRSSTRADRSA